MAFQRIQPTREEVCQTQIDECNALRCPYGISRTYDENECERCECENPCRGYLCSEDSKCAVDLRADPQLGSTFAPVCRKSMLEQFGKSKTKRIRLHANNKFNWLENNFIFFLCFLLPVNKPGDCPALPNNTRCDTECYTDADCRGDNKCCSAGCGQVCVAPADEREQDRGYVCFIAT